MKKILLVSIFALVAALQAFAQNEGRSFIQGNVGINFNSTKPETNPAFKNYSYGLSGRFGKFRTNNRAEGLVLSSGMQAQSRQFQLYDENGVVTTIDLDDLGEFSIGAGHFWQFYKHFGEKAGIYGGPELMATYKITKSFTQGSDPRSLTSISDRGVTVGLSLNLGAYYKLSERWWLDAGLGFSNPFSITYRNVATEQVITQAKNSGKAIEYSFSPSIYLPSIGVGLRYMLK